MTNSRIINLIGAIIGTGLFMTFVVGLAKSIANGFAGFEGALPFILIVGFVSCLALYDLFDQCIRKH